MLPDSFSLGPIPFALGLDHFHSSTFNFAVLEYWSVMIAAFTGRFRRLKGPFRLGNVYTEKKNHG
jgi:hypothetical protein